MYKNLFMLVVCFFIIACSNKPFVVNKKMIDPTSVNPNPQLALPPVYYLSEEQIADERRIIRQNNKKVSQFFLGSYVENDLSKVRVDDTSKLTAGDLQILELTKAMNSKQDIRDTLNQETLNEIEKNSGFIKKIFAGKSVNALDNVRAEYLKLNKNYNTAISK
jgi:hypothetical protein